MKKTAIFFIIGLGILFVVVSAQIALNIYIDNLSRPDDYTFDFEETDGTWELLWEKQNRYLGRSMPRTRNQFVATMNTLCYVAPEEDSFFRQVNLICVDIHDGKQKWIGRADSRSTLANDEKQIYVGGFNQHIRAYNAENGQEIWHKWINAKGIGRVTAYNGFVSVDGSPAGIDVFDASNGSLQSKDSVSIMGFDSFANDGNVRFENGYSHIYAHDIQDNSLIWDAYFEKTIAHRPVFSNGLIIVRSGNYQGAIQVIDSKTGGLLWKKEGVVSDVGVNDTTLFFVTTHGEVLAVDVETGETQGRLMLDDAELNDQEGAFASYSAYFIRATDDVVIVYLGDTGQLFSFRYSNE